ncbi:cation efflux family-domain-containing protein [Thamnidium elegans]|nr:cation efflux family-domain-containing protein [Thamnidium elegans]
MTQEKPLEGSIPRKAGITIQSSAPLYAQRHHDHLQPTHHDNGEKAPSVTTNANLNPYGSGQHGTPPNLLVQSHDNNSHDHIYQGDNQVYHVHAHHDHAHHDHSQHDHSQHNHSQHDHSQHDHSHHDNAHHDHGHDHHGHSHAPQHNYTPVYTRPLPSWIEIFSQLSPVQKTIFTWFLVHSGIGVWLYCMGTSRESLSLVGFSYLVIFDALGVLNSFVSSVLKTNSAFGISNTKRPYGAHRYEIVFALGTTIYLMFATMHNTKESLEHFLLKEHHGKSEVRKDHHLKISLGMFFLVGFALTATCLSCITLRNHDNFVRYLRRRPTTVQGFSYNVINRARGNPIHALLSNVYSLSIALCGSVILVTYMFGIATPFVDNFLALSESVVMFYLGYPTAKALAKVLLQTTPNTVQNGVENRLREIQQDPNILHVDRVHFWQTTYGKCVGTIEIQVRSDADEQAVLQLVYQKLEGLTSSDDNESELTVSIFK